MDNSAAAAADADVASSCARVNVEILPAIDWEAGVAKHGNARSFTAALCHFALGTPVDGDLDAAEAQGEAPLAQALSALRDSADALATSGISQRSSPGSGAVMQAEALEEVSALMEESRLLRDSAHLLCAERMHNQITKLESLCQHLHAKMTPPPNTAGRTGDSSDPVGGGALLTRCRQLVREIAYEANRMRESARAARSKSASGAETDTSAPATSSNELQWAGQQQSEHVSLSQASLSPSRAPVPEPVAVASLLPALALGPAPGSTKHRR